MLAANTAWLASAAQEAPKIDSGDTAWMLASTALVLFMTPGLAFFYGGMTRAKSVLNMLMLVIGAIGIVGVVWAVVGYSVAFASDQHGIIGSPTEAFGLKGLLLPESINGTIPSTVFVGFQGVFAIITVALIAGAIADRTRFIPWLVFAAIWVVVIYSPVAHWVWGKGWLASLGALDFAGGTVVHVNAGAAGLALALILGKRKGWPKEPMRPHNLPLVMLGAGILWFGWFGFNAGSALTSGALAGVAFINTLVATCAAMLGWLLLERIRDGRPTTLGAASGIVAGLVAITPACGFVGLWGALAIGFIAGVLCALAVGLKYKLGFDDSLDVVGVHLVGGLLGALLIGLFGTKSVNPSAGADGLFYGGGMTQFWHQATAVGAVLGYSLVGTLIIGFLIKITIGFRAKEEAEISGIDEAEHAESAYEFTGIRAGGVSLAHTADKLAAKVPATASKES